MIEKNKIKTVIVCGSMAFYSDFQRIAEGLKKEGFNVHIPTEEEVLFDDMSPEDKIRTKKQYIQEHLERIKESDYVVIANFEKGGVRGYIGPNTLIEVAFARVLNKPLYIIEEPGEQYCIDELRGFDLRLIDLEKSISTQF